MGGVAGVGWTLVALGLAVMSAQAARADELRAPRNVNAEPATDSRPSWPAVPRRADMKGQPQQAVELAEPGASAPIRAIPWPYYDKGMALAELGETDARDRRAVRGRAALLADRPLGQVGRDLRPRARAQPGRALRRGGAGVRRVRAVRRRRTIRDRRDDGAALRDGLPDAERARDRADRGTRAHAAPQPRARPRRSVRRCRRRAVGAAVEALRQRLASRRPCRSAASKPPRRARACRSWSWRRARTRPTIATSIPVAMS